MAHNLWTTAMLSMPEGPWEGNLSRQQHAAQHVNESIIGEQTFSSHGLRRITGSDAARTPAEPRPVAQRVHQSRCAQPGGPAAAAALLLKDGASAPASGTVRRRANAWTREEEEALAAAVAAQPLGARPDWVDVAKHVPGRTCKQCREKWRNDVRPDINKKPWTTREEYILALAHSLVGDRNDGNGNKWSEIAEYLPQRPENTVKNHWYATNRARSRETLLWIYTDLVEKKAKKDSSAEGAAEDPGNAPASGRGRWGPQGISAWALLGAMAGEGATGPMPRQQLPACSATLTLARELYVRLQASKPNLLPLLLDFDIPPQTVSALLAAPGAASGDEAAAQKQLKAYLREAGALGDGPLPAFDPKAADGQDLMSDLDELLGEGTAPGLGAGVGTGTALGMGAALGTGAATPLVFGGGRRLGEGDGGDRAGSAKEETGGAQPMDADAWATDEDASRGAWPGQVQAGCSQGAWAESVGKLNVGRVTAPSVPSAPFFAGPSHAASSQGAGNSSAAGGARRGFGSCSGAPPAAPDGFGFLFSANTDGTCMLKVERRRTVTVGGSSGAGSGSKAASTGGFATSAGGSAATAPASGPAAGAVTPLSKKRVSSDTLAGATPPHKCGVTPPHGGASMGTGHGAMRMCGSPTRVPASIHWPPFTGEPSQPWGMPQQQQPWEAAPPYGQRQVQPREWEGGAHPEQQSQQQQRWAQQHWQCVQAQQQQQQRAQQANWQQQPGVWQPPGHFQAMVQPPAHLPTTPPTQVAHPPSAFTQAAPAHPEALGMMSGLEGKALASPVKLAAVPEGAECGILKPQGTPRVVRAIFAAAGEDEDLLQQLWADSCSAAVVAATQGPPGAAAQTAAEQLWQGVQPSSAARAPSWQQPEAAQGTSPLGAGPMSSVSPRNHMQQLAAAVVAASPSPRLATRALMSAAAATAAAGLGSGAGSGSPRPPLGSAVTRQHPPDGMAMAPAVSPLGLHPSRSASLHVPEQLLAPAKSASWQLPVLVSTASDQMFWELLDLLPEAGGALGAGALGGALAAPSTGATARGSQGQLEGEAAAGTGAEASMGAAAGSEVGGEGGAAAHAAEMAVGADNGGRVANTGQASVEVENRLACGYTEGMGASGAELSPLSWQQQQQQEQHWGQGTHVLGQAAGPCAMADDAQHPPAAVAAYCAPQPCLRVAPAPDPSLDPCLRSSAMEQAPALSLDPCLDPCPSAVEEVDEEDRQLLRELLGQEGVAGLLPVRTAALAPSYAQGHACAPPPGSAPLSQDMRPACAPPSESAPLARENFDNLDAAQPCVGTGGGGVEGMAPGAEQQGSGRGVLPSLGAGVAAPLGAAGGAPLAVYQVTSGPTGTGPYARILTVNR